MRKFLTILFLLVCSTSFAQHKYVVKVQGAPGITKAQLDSTANLKLAITDTTNKWVNTLANNATNDSLIYWVGSVRHAIKVVSNQVNSDWNASTGAAQILNKPAIPSATSQLTNDAGFITSSAITGKINYTDSSSMLSPYLRKVDTTGKWISPAVANATYATISNLNLKANIDTTIAGYGITDAMNSYAASTTGGDANTTNSGFIANYNTPTSIVNGAANGYGGLIAFSSGANNNNLQLQYDNGHLSGFGDLYFRTKSSSGWHSWKKVINDSLLNAALSNYLTLSGNAASSTKLQTARNINGVPFDGTSNITVADATKEPTITAGTTSQFWRGDKTWQNVSSLPVQTAVQTALNAKLDTSYKATIGVVDPLNYDSIALKLSIRQNFLDSIRTGKFGGTGLNGTGFVKASGTTISYDNSTYLNVNGLAGGQTVYGGINASDNLNIYSTSNATKGNVYVGNSHSYFTGSTGELVLDNGTGNSQLYFDPNGRTIGMQLNGNPGDFEIFGSTVHLKGTTEVLLEGGTVLTAGTTTVAPLTFTSGSLLTTPANGTVEYNGSHFYGTVGGTRYQLDQQTTGSGFAVLSGTSGGQVLNGGTNSGDSLTLSSTSNATKGKIKFGLGGASYYDEVNSNLWIGKTVSSHLNQIEIGGSDGRTIEAFYDGAQGNLNFSSANTTFFGNLGLWSDDKITFANHSASLTSDAYLQINPTDSNFTINYGGTRAINISRVTGRIGNVGISGITNANAKLEISSADGTAGSAPLMVDAGTLLTTPVNNAIENDGNKFYLTLGGNRSAIAIDRIAAAPATTGTMTTTLDRLSAMTITPTGTCTFNASGGYAGQRCTFIITTSGTTAYTLTFGTNFKSTGTLSTGTVTGKVFTVQFVYDGTNWNEASRTTAM